MSRRSYTKPPRDRSSRITWYPKPKPLAEVFPACTTPRAESDEYVCGCGRRWGRDEERPCPQA